MPLILQRHCIDNDKVPNLAFVGFYEGPYWGVMEMQAEHIAQKWATANAKASSLEALPQSTDQSAELEEIRTIRDAQKKQDPAAPQFWMGDHIGVRREIATSLIEQETISGDSPSAIPLTLKNHLKMERRAHDFRQNEVRNSLVPTAVFRTFQGHWQLESGTLKTRDGFEMQATRRHVYRYKATPPSISVWFVKGDGLSADYHFHDMKHWEKAYDDTSKPSGWQAKGEHLCEADMYYPVYLFQFRGSNVEKFRVSYTVKGPTKDYTSSTWFTRKPGDWTTRTSR